jgi:uncharacterized protein YuzE
MKITFDPVADTLTIIFSETPVAETTRKSPA